ncbi:hypothetical protein NSK_003018 [Nannochloropsis salina CCMP1776]|uniref:Uncharacterized protein n=1 Tax=Nannochloropsis salina CCMP1776 TaxID=1027361 RepID=A0A4D9DA58_9STRA|nr:hypothetical protein NSK_003018 [Nannochloropsis salina CCMP1776]|eukprot:TFJ85508.1 hypothetical protein NSK_003018 [Nannochloropsis salina CCMP1776]
MMLLPPEAPQSFISTSTNLMIAASRYIKDVPSTLTDMADEAADAVASTPAYTNPDGSYTNAGEVVEEVYNGVNTELPPPYYAVAFALVLLVVSGIQQLSLGNVFDDEEKSASSSGAVARRMNMRNRSFFKKK